MKETARVPTATYRLQFSRSFTLRDAIGLVPYLADLGIGAVYASPLMAARAGSDHGYDVVDPTRLNPEVGTEEDLDALGATLREREMGLVLDIVPNHTCVADPSNVWWSDVLENGTSSPYARFFDIDWSPPKPELAGKVLLPFLGDQYGRVLESREIRVDFRGGAFAAECPPTRLPLAPHSWPLILEPALEVLRARPDGAEPAVVELESILTALAHLPRRDETDPDRIRERLREKEVIKRRLGALAEASPEARKAIESSLGELNGRRGDPRSFDRLEALLAAQPYRLCFWRVAADEINYRRFFDVNELAALRVEDPEVFRAVHERVLEFVRRGWVTGFRVDHVDGLYDPPAYLRALQESAGQALGQGAGAEDRPFHVVVEKVLEGNERLSPDWPVHGTTGYDFLNTLNGIFVDPAASEAFAEGYRRLDGGAADVAELVATCKKLMMNISLSSELFTLARRLDLVSEHHRGSRDFTLESQRFALREVIARLPVYRTYVGPRGEVRPEDRERVERAVAEAMRHNPAVSPSLFEFIRQVWLLEHPEGLTEAQREERRQFVLRLQQVTGPVMAKGVEDTFFYRHFPLASLNEVGAEPARFGVPLERFHALNQDRLRSWPHALLATSTHDTKRGEDARARLNALSEIPGEWFAAVDRWRAMNRRHKPSGEGVPAPGANEEYFLYQTLIGAWPAGSSLPPPAGFVERIEEYLIKAAREAKVHTSWIHPVEAYEAATRAFLRAILEPRPKSRFLPDFLAFQERVARAGILNSLAQVLLKAASPGVPDFYRGSELWDLSLVDPDNRRPVDFQARREALESLAREADPAALARRLMSRPEDGVIKMFVMRAALGLRRSERRLFEEGEYLPLETAGPLEDHVCAFARLLGDRAIVAATGRFFLRAGIERVLNPGSGLWKETRLALPPELAGAAFRDALTGTVVRARPDGTLALDEAFGTLPMALLVRSA